MRFKCGLNVLSDQNFQKCRLIEKQELSPVIDLCMNYNACMLFSKNYYPFAQIYRTNWVWEQLYCNPHTHQARTTKPSCSGFAQSNSEHLQSLNLIHGPVFNHPHDNKQTKNNHLFPHKKSEFPMLQLSCHCVLPGTSHLFSPYTPLRCLSGQEDFPLTFLFTRLNNWLVSTSPMPHAPTLELLWWPSASVLYWGA